MTQDEPYFKTHHDVEKPKLAAPRMTSDEVELRVETPNNWPTAIATVAICAALVLICMILNVWS